MRFITVTDLHWSATKIKTPTWDGKAALSHQLTHASAFSAALTNIKENPNRASPKVWMFSWTYVGKSIFFHLSSSGLQRSQNPSQLRRVSPCTCSQSTTSMPVFKSMVPWCKLGLAACRLEQTGTEPPTSQLVGELLYHLSYSHPFKRGLPTYWFLDHVVQMLAYA